MAEFDLLVRTDDRDLGIRDGVIVSLGDNLAGAAAREFDARGLAVFPGVIDAHVHFNEPGRSEWEGFATGSRAAAAGGTTTVFDMPLNAHPPTIDGPSFQAKRAAAEEHSLVDFGLWGGLVPGNLGELETLRARGVVGLKAFMSESGIDDFAAVDEATLGEGMARAAALGLLVAVHAEAEAMTRRLADKAIAAGRTTVRDYLASRPIAAELEAIRRALDLAHATGCRLHVVHVSCAEGVKLVAEARAAGVDVTCETCPHYLVLNEEEMERLGAVAKCAPPLRAPGDQAKLRRVLAEVTTIGSDHSPSPPAMKAGADFFAVWGGISGCQHLLPLLCGIDELDFTQICRLTSGGVAERFGLRQKGGLEIGQDADLTLVDRRAHDAITAEGLHYRHRQSPYVGRQTGGRVVATFLRGQSIFENGNFAPRPSGRFVRPAAFSA